MKLYKIDCKGTNAKQPVLDVAYILANNLTDAHRKLKDYLEYATKNWEVSSIQLIAEDSDSPKCKTRLIFK